MRCEYMPNSNYVVPQMSGKRRSAITESRIYDGDRYLDEDQEIYVFMN